MTFLQFPGSACKLEDCFLLDFGFVFFGSKELRFVSTRAAVPLDMLLRLNSSTPTKKVMYNATSIKSSGDISGYCEMKNEPDEKKNQVK